MMIELWLFGVYVLGTLVGFWMGDKRGRYAATEQVIDSLIEKGYLKTDKDGNPVQCENKL